MLDYLKRKLPHNLKIRKTFWIIKGFFAYLKNFWVLNWVEVIWVTWTDWKTSTVIFTAQLFQNLWIKTAAMSSELYFINWKFIDNKSKRTTASPFEIFKFIKKAKEEWVEKIILEVSSHSLEQWRLFWINFDYSVITNLSQEHLDYHWTIKNYAKTKAKIISKTKKSVIIKKNILEKNIFEEEIWKNKNKKIEVFTWEWLINKNLFIWNNLRFENDWTLFDLNFWNIKWWKIFDLKLNVLWAYNIENIIFWIWVAHEILWEKLFENFWEDLKNSISKIKKVPWRLDELDFWQDFKIWISFAVTPQAVEETLKYAQKLKNKNWKVYLVFWATWWQHDHWKRPILWEIAWNWADFSVLTDDETYWEDSMKIISEVEEWFKSSILGATWKYKIIQDRWDAIRFALWNAKKWDVVIITWMGAFDSRNIWWIEEDWNDWLICKEFFKKV
jgi:UDP-N-acetylmuramoyl-L-alanyl-D-glutamate--2,6-diaminopimelate ligase